MPKMMAKRTVASFFYRFSIFFFFAVVVVLAVPPSCVLGFTDQEGQAKHHATTDEFSLWYAADESESIMADRLDGRQRRGTNDEDDACTSYRSLYLDTEWTGSLQRVN